MELRERIAKTIRDWAPAGTIVYGHAEECAEEIIEAIVPSEEWLYNMIHKLGGQIGVLECHELHKRIIERSG